jgi:hypothetical protein
LPSLTVTGKLELSVVVAAGIVVVVTSRDVDVSPLVVVDCPVALQAATVKSSAAKSVILLI